MLFGFMTSNKLARVAKQMGVEMVFVAGDLSYAGIDADMPRIDVTSDDEVHGLELLIIIINRLSANHSQFEHIWDILGVQNEPIASAYPVCGNHYSAL